MKLTYAFCTYNRAKRLPALVAAMRAQASPIAFDILAVNNNSTDDTAAVLSELSNRPGPALRIVTEPKQGIVPARNRVIEEAMDSDILIFIDDDEMPRSGVLVSACQALLEEGADCAGGRVNVDFSTLTRPAWLEDDLLGFLAEVNHGPHAFWIQDDSTPVWTSNIAYRMEIFRNDPTLRFDTRYNREGTDIGGGEDAIMLASLLTRKLRIRYCPGMAVDHSVEAWRLKRSYFLKLHYKAGVQFGKYEMGRFQPGVLGFPSFMLNQVLCKSCTVLGNLALGKPSSLRLAMNVTHAIGSIVGYLRAPRITRGFR